MRKTLLSAAVLGCFAAPSVVLADEPASEHTFTGNVTLASEYIYRGIAQTNRKPAIQGGFDYAHASGFYIGTWASNISWLSDAGGVSAPIEMDLYGGYRGAAGDFTYDLGGLYYYYPGTYPDGFTSPNTFELYGAAGWKWFTAKYSYSTTNLFGWKAPDGEKTSGSYYLELNGAYDLGNGFGLTGHVGYQDVKGFDDASYTDWKVGASYTVNGFAFGLAYVGTNAKGEPGDPYRNAYNKDLGAARVVFSLGKTF